MRRWLARPRFLFPLSHNGKRIRLLSTMPSGSLQHKIDFILQQPSSALTQQHLQFCHTTLELLSKKNNMGEMAEQLLERALQQEESVLGNQPIALWYRWVIQAWSRTASTTCTTNSNTNTNANTEHQNNNLPYPVFRAHQLLERMKARHNQHSQYHPAPNITTYDALLYSCAVSPFPERVLDFAQTLIQTMETSANPPPSTTSYNHILSIWTQLAKQQQYGAASAAEDWLLHLSQQTHPDTSSFNRVLHAWCCSGAPDRANDILQFMVSHAIVDVVSFATVQHGYHRQPEAAERVFQQALEYFLQQSTNSSPVDVTVCLDEAMMAWAYSGRPEATERVQALLRDAYLLQNEKIQLKPTAATHRIVLHAFVNNDRIEDASRHLYDMIASYRPTTTASTSILSTWAFHLVLQAWLDSHRPEAPQKCLELLQQMMQLSQQGIPCAPETSTFLRVLNVLLKHKCPPDVALDVLQQAEQRQMVNFYVYKTVLQLLERHVSYALVAYSVYRRAQAADGVNMESSALHRMTMDVLLKQNTAEARELAFQICKELPEHSVAALEISYGSVLQAFAGTARAGEVASELYERMQQSRLIQWNATIVRALIETWSGEMKYRKKACDLLREMVQNPQIAGPDRECMDLCLWGLCCTEDATQSQQAVLLLECLAQHHQQGRLLDLPSKTTFRMVYESCQRHYMEEEAKRIQRLARSCFNKS